MMMPDDNHLSLAGFRRRQPVGVGLSTGRIALPQTINKKSVT
jgi:hypothetical protein